jgi:hypothetical protein
MTSVAIRRTRASSRRAVWSVPAAFVAVAALAGPRHAAAAELTDQQVLAILAGEQPRDRAIKNALAWIRAQQQANGAVGEKKHETALTSLSIMAHLAAGITFTDPEHGAWLRKSLVFVLGEQDPKGYFGGNDGSRMYGHGICTLMLAEAIGMVREEELEDVLGTSLERALSVTMAAARVQKNPQNAGGWRYQPNDGGADLSLSGWQLMSLHAAQQVGIPVDREVVKGAVEYAKRLTTDDGKVGYESRGDDRPALRGLGMLCFAIGREEQSPVVSKIAERIANDPIAWRGPWFFYRAYYDAVGMSRARPEAWEQYAPRLTTVLVEHQKNDGSWGSPPGDNESGNGTVYTTCMAALALAVDRHVLPAYQR